MAFETMQSRSHERLLGPVHDAPTPRGKSTGAADALIRRYAQAEVDFACVRYAVARSTKFDLSLSAALRNLAALDERRAEHDLADARGFLEWLDLKRLYDPAQPRVPAGQPDGGQWVGDNHRDPGSGRTRHDGVQLAQNAPTGRFWTFRPTSFRINGVEQDLNLQDEVLVGAVTLSRDMAVTAARALVPTYRPPDGLYASVDGFISYMRDQRDDAELFAINYTRAQDGLPPLSRSQYLAPTSPSLRNTPTSDLLEPAGNPIGWRERGAGPGIQTVDPETFNDLGVRLTFGSNVVDSRPGYGGVTFQRADGCVFGCRISRESGPTFDIFDYAFNISPPVSKVHQK